MFNLQRCKMLLLLVPNITMTQCQSHFWVYIACRMLQRRSAQWLVGPVKIEWCREGLHGVFISMLTLLRHGIFRSTHKIFYWNGVPLRSPSTIQHCFLPMDYGTSYRPKKTFHVTVKWSVMQWQLTNIFCYRNHNHTTCDTTFTFQQKRKRNLFLPKMFV